MKKFKNIVSAIFMFAGAVVGFIMAWTVIDEANWTISSSFVFWGMSHYGAIFVCAIIMTAVFVRRAVRT